MPLFNHFFVGATLFIPGHVRHHLCATNFRKLKSCGLIGRTLVLFRDVDVEREFQQGNIVPKARRLGGLNEFLGLTKTFQPKKKHQLVPERGRSS